MKDLLFLAGNLKDQVSILLSVNILDETKFIDLFTDFSFGTKSTEVVVTAKSLEPIHATLQQFFAQNSKRVASMVFNYKIKFCYFNK